MNMWLISEVMNLYNMKFERVLYSNISRSEELTIPPLAATCIIWTWVPWSARPRV